MPDPVLNAFQGLSHLIITKSSDVGTNNKPISQMRKLKHGEDK